MSKEQKLDWIYKGANSLVEREEYLLGRKVDKTLEQLNEEEKEKKFVLPTPKNHVEHECIPPSIRDFNKIVLAEQVDLSAKLQEDPLVAIKKREEEARRQFLQNPVQLKKLQEALRKQQEEKIQKKSKKKKKQSDLDEKLKEKLKLLKNNSLGISFPKKESKKDKEDSLNTILMHKFNALKDKLSEDDIKDILNGKVTDGTEEEKSDKIKKKKKHISSDSDDEFDKQNKYKKRKGKYKKNRSVSTSSSSSESSSKDKFMTSQKIKDNKNNSKYRREKQKTRYSSSSSETEGDYQSNSYRKINPDRKGKTKDESQYRNKKRQNRSSSEEKYTNRRDRSKHRNEITERELQRGRDWKQSYKRRENSSDYDRKEKRKTGELETKTKINYHSESDLDEKIMAKLRLLRGEVEVRAEKSTKVVEKESRDNVDNIRNQNKPDRTMLPAKPPHLKQSSEEDSGSSESSGNHKKVKTLYPKKPDHLRRRSSSEERSSSKEQPSKEKYEYNSDNESQKPRSFGLVTSDGKKIALRKNADVKISVNTSKKIELPTRPERKQVKKLTEEEKQKLREEMMRDAEIRDKEREKNVKRYREKDKKEEEIVSKKFDAEQIHTSLLKSAKNSSVEQRIKSNLNNIQRSSRHMDSNFSKR